MTDLVHPYAPLYPHAGGVLHGKAVSVNGSSSTTSSIGKFAVLDPIAETVRAFQMTPPSGYTFNHSLWGGGASGNNIFGGIFSGNMRMQAAVGGTANWVYTPASTGLASWEWSSSGSAWTIRKNNTLQSLTLGGGANNGGWLSIAARDRLGIGTAVYNNINDSWFDGHIAMIAFGGSPLTADERSVVYDIINYKYGV